MFRVIAALFLAVSLLSACASSTDEKAPKTAEQLYNEAYGYLEKTSYFRSAEIFEKIEVEHPYSKWAVKAKIMAGYAYYKDQKYDEAVMAFDRFIRFHPGNKDVAYAYYMKAICYYDQVSDVKRDQSNTQRALEALFQVVSRFPKTDYAKDAGLKIDLTKDHLAGQEMEVGRYYLNQNNYLSALNRFSEVVNNYQTTSHIEEALYRQVELYKILGLNDEAATAYRFLSHNYPKSKWANSAKEILSKK